MVLPSEDSSASFGDYADVVCAALTDHDEVVLVGHSFGGYTIPLVADRRPIQHLVQIATLLVPCSTLTVTNRLPMPPLIAFDSSPYTPRRCRSLLDQFPATPAAYVVSSDDQMLRPKVVSTYRP